MTDAGLTVWGSWSTFPAHHEVSRLDPIGRIEVVLRYSSSMHFSLWSSRCSCGTAIKRNVGVLLEIRLCFTN